MSFLREYYRTGRRVYNLPATEAIAYARQRQTMWESDMDWDAQPDGQAAGQLVVFLFDEGEAVITSLGGVEFDFDVSDHGNLLMDYTHPFLVGIVADLIEEVESGDRWPDGWAMYTCGYFGPADPDHACPDRTRCVEVEQ